MSTKFAGWTFFLLGILNFCVWFGVWYMMVFWVVVTLIAHIALVRTET